MSLAFVDRWSVRVGGVPLLVLLDVGEDGKPREVQVTVESDEGSTEGSQILGIVNLTSKAINKALKKGMPWSELDTFEFRRDDFCCGPTSDPHVARATSLWDYVYKAVAARLPVSEVRQ